MYLHGDTSKWGVCKQWNGLLEWWNTRMAEWKIIKVYYEFLHLNIP